MCCAQTICPSKQEVVECVCGVLYRAGTKQRVTEWSTRAVCMLVTVKEVVNAGTE